MSLADDVLAQITPSPDERARVDGIAKDLERACKAALEKAGLEGTPSVQGSVAKDTWLAGNTDLDCFLLMDPGLDDAALKRVAETVGSAVLDDARKKYAQHPYLVGEFQGLQVDLVPAYAVTDPAAKMSAVDRTPFHTAWVLSHLDATARGQVRLLKRWCKGVGVYGAETRIGGFSGYLLEVLVHRFGGFDGVLGWFGDGCAPARIAVGADAVEDDVSPLVVVDPVDPTRNCAAAVQEDTIALAQEAARTYQAAADPRFFHPSPPRPEPSDVLDRSMHAQSIHWTGLVAAPATDRLDIVFPQFQKAGRLVAAELVRAGFPVRRHRVDAYDDDRHVGLQWVTDAITLDAERLHEGPLADAEPNAGRFRDKWQGHPDALGPVEEGPSGRLQVRVAVRERTAAAWLQAHLHRLAFGKHVSAAIAADPTVHTGPADVPPGWAATVADHVLDRRPWQRP